jgi:hypothetical protein
MSQGNDFANYSAAASSGSTGAEDVWFVAVASDDIKQMNVDQLDEAFRLGVITAETAVWTEGMEAWAPLGQVADLEGSSEESDSDPSGRAAHASHHDNHSSAHDYADARDDRRREPELREAPATLPPVGYNSGSHDSGSHDSGSHGGAFSSTLQSTPHRFSPGPNSISPVTSSYAPTASSGPVALNVDEDMPSIRHGRRFRPERWALGAAALVAIGVVGYNNMVSSSVASAGTQAPAAAAAPVASRAYDSADGVEHGEKLTAKASATEQPQAAAAQVEGASAKSSEGTLSDTKSAASKSSAAEADAADDEAPTSPKSKAGEKDSLKGSFSKAFNKKAPAAKAAKVKPRKAAMRATTKARATKGAKKAGVAREKSAFDPLNDSLP